MSPEEILLELEALEPLREQIMASALIYNRPLKDEVCDFYGVNRWQSAREPIYNLSYVLWEIIERQYVKDTEGKV